MEVLHPVRGSARGGVRRAVVVAALLALGCEADVPLELRPDSILRTSLGLSDRDAVHRVRVAAVGTAEVAEPARVSAEPGAWVSFQGGDARGHVVRFDTLALAPAAVAWLRDTDQVESPPLLTTDARWVVSFQDAPEGDYPFVVEGSGRTGRGRIEIRSGGD